MKHFNDNDDFSILDKIVEKIRIYLLLRNCKTSSCLEICGLTLERIRLSFCCSAYIIKEEQRFKVFEYKVMNWIFGRKD